MNFEVLLAPDITLRQLLEGERLRLFKAQGVIRSVRIAIERAAGNSADASAQAHALEAAEDLIDESAAQLETAGVGARCREGLRPARAPPVTAALSFPFASKHRHCGAKRYSPLSHKRGTPCPRVKSR